MNGLPGLAPIFLPGQEPLPPGYTEQDRANMREGRRYQDLMQQGMESCVAKSAMAGGMGAPHANKSEWVRLMNK